MLQEHLLQIILNKDIYTVLIFILFLWNWFIFLKLGFTLNKSFVNNFRLLIFALIGTICTFCVKVFLPIYFTGLINVLVLVCFFYFSGIKLVKAFFTSFFILMMLNLNKEDESKKNNTLKFVGVFTAGLLLIGVLGVFRGIQENHVLVENVDQGVGLTKNLGRLLFNEYVLPFELASILILAGIVGAVLIGKKDL